LLVVSIVTVIAAAASDKFGRKKILSMAAILFIFTTIPMMYLVNTKDTFSIFGAQLFMAIAVGMYFGPIPALMIEAFPTRVRYSASSLTTNISGPLFGGTAPMLVTWLIDKTGSTMVPAFYLTGAAVFALIAVQCVRNVTQKNVAE
jgi:MHS family proline/betaine transporter-like MFS transporter